MGSDLVRLDAEGPARSTVTLALWALIWCLDERDGDPDLEPEEDRCGGFDDTLKSLSLPPEWTSFASSFDRHGDDDESSEQEPESPTAAGAPAWRQDGDG